MAVILGAVYIHTHDNLVKEKEISIEYALLNIQKKIGKTKLPVFFAS